MTIFEALADYGTYTKDPDVLTEYVRQSLARQITNQFAQGNESMKVITIGPVLEKRITEAVQQTEQGSYLALDPMTTQQIYTRLSEQVKRIVEAGNQPIILTSPTIRMYVRQIVDRTMPDVPVLSYNELEPSVEIQSVGVVNL